MGVSVIFGKIGHCAVNILTKARRIENRHSRTIKVEITTHSQSLEPVLWDDKPDFTGYNMKSFDQNHELWRALSPLVFSPVHNDFKNADVTYLRALSQYLDHHIKYIFMSQKPF